MSAPRAFPPGSLLNDQSLDGIGLGNPGTLRFYPYRRILPRGPRLESGGGEALAAGSGGRRSRR